MAAWVYMLRCGDGSVYTGWTYDLARRLRMHRSGRGARYTRSHLPVSLVYCQRCENRSAAMRKEAALKKLTHSQKEALIRAAQENKEMRAYALHFERGFDTMKTEIREVMMMKILRCNHCGNMTYVLHDSNVPMICCAEQMSELTANTTDGATEKHLPVVTRNNGKLEVVVGSVEHPMTEAHYIEWILLETDKGVQIRHLTPADEPKAVFEVAEGTPVAVYEYCNLHGVWKTEL